MVIAGGMSVLYFCANAGIARHARRTAANLAFISSPRFHLVQCRLTKSVLSMVAKPCGENAVALSCCPTETVHTDGDCIMQGGSSQPLPSTLGAAERHEEGREAATAVPRRGACRAIRQRREDARGHERTGSPCLWRGPDAAPTHGARAAESCLMTRPTVAASREGEAVTVGGGAAAAAPGRTPGRGCSPCLSTATATRPHSGPDGWAGRGAGGAVGGTGAGHAPCTGWPGNP